VFFVAFFGVLAGLVKFSALLQEMAWRKIGAAPFVIIFPILCFI